MVAATRGARIHLDLMSVAGAHEHHVWRVVGPERTGSDGIAVRVAPDASKRGGARPGWNGGLYDLMRRVLATEHGGALYRKRRTMSEPVFAHTRFNRRIDRRGPSRCP
jgi:hypothetical protein